MKRIIYLILAIQSLGTSSGIAQFQQKPMLGEQIDPTGIGKGLVGCWAMLEGAGSKICDRSGNRKHGTCAGTYSWAPGKFGPAWQGDGDTSQIQISTAAGGTLNPNAITVSAWVKTTTTASNQDIVAHWKVGDATNQSYMLWLDSPNWSFLIQTSAGNDEAKSSATANVWTHLAGTYDGINTVKLYVNGVETNSDSTASGGLDSIVAADNLYIGDRAGGSNEWNGQIDNVLIYNRALTSQEIQELYVEPFCYMGPSWDVTNYVAAPTGGEQVIVIQMGSTEKVFLLLFLVGMYFMTVGAVGSLIIRHKERKAA